MRNSTSKLLGTALLASTCVAGASTRFVNASNTAPATPFTTWASAAVNIQDAVNISLTGDLILVTNGLYAGGGRIVFGAMSNRVALIKAITVRSVNGPAVTTIRGARDVGSGNGDAALRCAYLAAGAQLSGFTLTNGATRGAAGDWSNEQGGGGVWCESATAVVSNCVITGNSAYDHGAGAAGGTLVACLVTNNTASDTVVASGGGAYSSVLSNCTVAYNGSLYGGGVASSTLDHCTLIGNVAVDWGGAGSFSTLTYCTLIGNSASSGGGGGTYSCTLTNCVLTGNWIPSSTWGGATYGGSLYNCILSGNLASSGSGGGAASADLKNCALTGNQAGYGGGTYGCTLNNCTLSGNWVSFEGGGDYGSALTNCILYYNSSFTLSGSNWSGSTARSCCSAPLLPGGPSNFTNAPLFLNLAAGDLHLQPNSPCVNAGLNSAAPGPVDLDGNTRIIGGAVDLGAYESSGRPLFLPAQAPGPTGMTLQLIGVAGHVVEFHASSNLSQWFLLASRTNTTGQITYTDTQATNQPRRCYKAIQLP